MKRLENKIAVITGGTTGIGLATAKLFAAEGAKVTVTGANPKTLEAARLELKGIADVIASDAGSGKDIEKLASAMKTKYGSVDVLFLNAGIGKFGSILEFDEATFDELFRVNFKGPWLALRYFIPLMHRGGSIVLNASVLNQKGMPGTSAYSATKAAIRSLARTAAAELADAGIRVNVVSPGPIETPIYGKLGMPAEALQGLSNSIIAQVSMKRFGRADEVAKAALFLACDDSSFITGEEIRVDGGLTEL